MENSLPKGWEELELKYLGEYINGRAFKPIEWKTFGLPIIRIQNLNKSEASYNFSDKEHEEKYRVRKGDLLMAWSASLGVYIWQGQDAWLNQHIFKVLPNTELVTKEFLFYALKEAIDDFYQKTHGSGMVHITKPVFEAHKVPLPPLAEQHRIVAKLDALLAKVANCKNRLEKIPALLKTFRQSVLAAAVSGEGEEEITGNICDNIQIGPFGTQLHKHDYISNGIPLVNPTHIQFGQIVPDLDLTVSKTKYKELSNYYLKAGDVVMGRRGEMARCALVSEKENGWLCGTGSLFFRPNIKKVHPEYLYWTLSSQITKTFLEGESKGTTMSNLNLTIVKNIPMILPSLEEQKEIVRKVKELFHFADSIEVRYQKAKAWFDKIPQAILAKAFRGKLVEQDENDEPASVLLERIKKEKQNTNKPKPTAKRKTVYEEKDSL